MAKGNLGERWTGMRGLWILLICALLLRAAMLGWGLPIGNPHARPYHPDEAKIIEAAAQFPAHIVENTDFRYPTFLHYLVGAVSAVVWGPQPGVDGHFWAIYLLGRVVSLLAGLAAVGLLYQYGVRYLCRPQALLAAALLSFSLYHAQSSAWATTDVTSAFMLTATLLAGRWAAEETGSPWAFAAAGLLFGALIGVRYTGLVALPALALVYGAASARGDRGIGGTIRTAVTDWRLPVFGLAAAVAFFVSTPGALLHYDMLPEAFRYETARLDRSSFLQLSPGIWLGSLGKMVTAFGAPMVAAALVGMAVTLRKGVAEWAPAVLVVGVLFGFGDALLPRYLILVAPMVALLAAVGLSALYRDEPKWRRLAAGALAAGVVLYSLLYTAAGTYSRLQETRTEAAAYLANSVSPGTSIGVAYTAVEYAWEAHAFRYPRIDRTRLAYLDFLEEPEVVVVSSYDLEPIRRALQSDVMLPNYEWPEAKDDVWYRGAEPTPEIFRFYDRLLSGRSAYCQVAMFTPQVLAPIEFPPPEIRVFACGETAPESSCQGGS